ncbi:MAG: hypothetical protein ACKV0T_16500 [Planctomycetales bacterium]
MSRSSNSAVYGIIAIGIGFLLVMSGLAFLLVTQLINNASPLLAIPPLIQIGLGITGAIAGLFLWRGNAAAKFVLAFVGFGVLANIGFLLILAVSLLPK